MEVFEIVSEKRCFANGGFSYEKNITGNKAHHCDIQVAEMISEINVCFVLLDLVAFLNLHWEENANEICPCPVAIDFSAIFFPTWNPDTNQNEWKDQQKTQCKD